MDFFEHQERARRSTRWLILLYLLAVAGIVLVVNAGVGLAWVMAAWPLDNVPAGKRSYGAFVTAADPDAPPILQWDRPERRIPVSCYVYTSGSAPEAWNLDAGGYHPLTAIALQPWMWDGAEGYPHQGRGALLIVLGARDLTYTSGAGLFPAFLKSDYHGIRATIEAHTKGAVVAGAAEATACGLFLHKGTTTWNYLVRVTAGSAVQTYNLDRWD